MGVGLWLPGFKPAAKLKFSHENSRMLNTCIRLVFVKNKIESDFESLSLDVYAKVEHLKPMANRTTSRPPFANSLIFKGAPRGTFRLWVNF